MKTVEEMFKESAERIEKADAISEITSKIKEITTALYTKELGNWNGDQISRAIASLAILRVNLGLEVADSVAYYDMSYLRRKVRYANEWKPTKDALNKKLQKATVADIDSEIMAKLEEDMTAEVQNKHYSEQMKILYDSTETLITALQSRLSILKQERRETNHY